MREAIESVLNQPCKDLELICVDDGSPDNSGNICDEYARKDERVKVIHKENEGVAVARNVGMNASKGQWIAFLDSDDKWVNGFYIKEVNDLLQGPGKAYAFKYIKGDEKLNPVAYPCGKANNSSELKQISPFQKMCWQVIYNKSDLEKYNIIFVPGLKYCEDNLFVSNAIHCVDVVHIDRDILIYRNNPTSAMNTKMMWKDKIIPAVKGRMFYEQRFSDVPKLAKMNRACAFGGIYEHIVFSFREGRTILQMEQDLKEAELFDMYQNYQKYDLPDDIELKFEKYFKNKKLFYIKCRFEEFFKGIYRKIKN